MSRFRLLPTPEQEQALLAHCRDALYVWNFAVEQHWQPAPDSREPCAPRCEVVMSPTNSFEPVITVTGVDRSAINYEMRPAVSKEQLEKAVSRLVADAAGVQVASVSCDSGLEGKVGATAQCDVDAGGVKLRRTVEVNTVEGLMMNFDLVPVLTKEEVASSLLDEFERQLGRRPDSAQCAGNLEGKAGNTVDCTVVSGEDIRSFTLTVTTVSGGSINYSYAPRP
jgi:hypothetical protein